jgi:tetratricopeptide (TPR) repeat protein
MIAGCSHKSLQGKKEDPLSAQEHLVLGSIYEKKGKSDLALREYKAALKRDPQFLPAMIRLGELSYHLGDYTQAERYYRKAIKRAPQDGDLYNNLCWVYLSQGRKLKKAEMLIARAMDLTPEHRGYYLDTLGAIYIEDQHYREAIEVLEEAITLFDESQGNLLSQVYRRLGLAYERIGEQAKAENALKKARDLLEQ